MTARILLSIVCFYFHLSVKAQFNRYIIQFADKNNTPYSLQSPAAFLSEKSIIRRSMYQIPVDSLDLPVNSNYIDAVSASGNVLILNASKWLNSISIQTTDMNALANIQALPFVMEVRPIASRRLLIPFNKFQYDTSPSLSNQQQRSGNYYNYGLSEPQIQMHQTPFLHNLGFRGDSVSIALLDAGFYRYDQFATFDSVRIHGQIVDTWDFVNDQASVSEDDAHGMQCLSTIAANLPGRFIGSAPKANFYLYRTEDVSSEYPIEEHNLACAAERADSAGVDICSISLGYTTFSDPAFNYSYNDMNGNTCISSKAVQTGSKKGMLFVIAAGNEGNSSWRFIAAPADAKDALTVGAVNSSGIPAGFSSYGPTSDGRIKPNVASQGSNSVISNSFDGQATYGNGTSFACPNLAGVTACIWQAFKEKKPSEILQAVQDCSSKINSPDNRVGYGIPDARKAFMALQKSGFTHQEYFNNCQSKITCNVKTNAAMHLIIEKKYPEESVYTEVADLIPNENWGMQSFQYTDDLLRNTSEVNYRYKMRIENDTTYVLDSSIVYFLNPCVPLPPNGHNVGHIILSPNPARNALYAFFNAGKSVKANWNIYNDKGQLIQAKFSIIPLEGSTTLFDITNFPAGLYFIKMATTDNEVFTARFMKW